MKSNAIKNMNRREIISALSNQMNIYLKTFFLILFLFGCIHNSSFAQDKTSESNPNIIPKQYRCNDDSDCILSCSKGAINRSSYKPSNDECEDGCSGKGMSVHCIKHLCEAFSRDGKKEKSCTLKENQRDESKRKL